MFYFSSIVRGSCIDSIKYCSLITKVSYDIFSECWYICSNARGLIELVIALLDNYGIKVLFGNLEGKLIYLPQVLNRINDLSIDPVINGSVIVESVDELITRKLGKLIRISTHIVVCKSLKIAQLKIDKLRISDLFKLGFRVLKPYIAPPKPKFLTHKRLDRNKC